MSDTAFDADWLDLREPVDHRSRARSLVSELRREGVRRGWSRIVDLGAGTGSNLRYLSARIPWAREWTVVDHDLSLLGRIVEPSPGFSVRRLHGDLSAEGLEVVGACDVVTASALLDLVSEGWLRALRDRCAATGAAVYLSLSYDGSVRWVDDAGTEAAGSVVAGADAASDGTDALVLDAVNEHQRSDKGLGPALGPEAVGEAEALFGEAGYMVRVEASPWILRGPGDAPLATRLVEGWAEAAADVRPEHEDRVRAWAERRIRDVATGVVTLWVGHLDLLALPPEAPTGGAASGPAAAENAPASSHAGPASEGSAAGSRARSASEGPARPGGP
jgi:SAM-dependent methyltransferase